MCRLPYFAETTVLSLLKYIAFDAKRSFKWQGYMWKSNPDKQTDTVAKYIYVCVYVLRNIKNIF